MAEDTQTPTTPEVETPAGTEPVETGTEEVPTNGENTGSTNPQGDVAEQAEGKNSDGPEEAETTSTQE